MKDEPIWCKMYRDKFITPKKRERITELRGRTRESRAGFYTSPAWKALREQHLNEHTLCIECEKNGRMKAAKIVDHIRPVDQAPELALEPSNLQSLCEFHHSRKTNDDKQRRKLEKGKELMQRFERGEGGV